MKRALISVANKHGILELAKFLQDEGIEIISTGGTKQALKDAGLKVVPVSSFTGAPEILEALLKRCIRRSPRESCSAAKRPQTASNWIRSTTSPLTWWL